METFSFVSNTKTLNKEVNVSAFYFKNRHKHLASFPKQMELDGQQYYFRDTALRVVVAKNDQLVQLFDVEDGQQTFRLRNVGEEWRLISMRAGA